MSNRAFSPPGIEYSVKTPLVVTFPSFPLVSVTYHRLPSGPVTIPKGRLFGVGIGNSLIDTVGIGAQEISPVVGSTVMPAGDVGREYVSGSLSGSTALTGYVYGCPGSAVVTGLLTITGGWLPAACATWTTYACVAVPPRPSDTVRVTFCRPSWLAVGCHCTSPLAGSMASPCGPLATAKVSASWSGSVAVAWYRYAVSTSALTTGAEVNTGGRFGGGWVTAR